MCLHESREIEAFRKITAAEGAREVELISVIKGAQIIAAWPCIVTDPVNIAQVLRDLKTWHPDGEIFSLYDVNWRRGDLGLEELSPEQLPEPPGVASPGIPDFDGSAWQQARKAYDYFREQYTPALAQQAGTSPRGILPDHVVQATYPEISALARA